MITPHELKSLQTKLAELQRQRVDYVKMQNDAQNNLKNIDKLIKNINDEISEATNNKGIIVTEHALLRWFERRYGFNLEEIQVEIKEYFKLANCNTMVKASIKADGMIAEIKNGVIITITKD